MITLEIMQRRWPHGDQHIDGLLQGIADSSGPVFAKYGVTSPLMIAHAMAQFSEECGQGLEMVENMNYTAQRLVEVFPTHFTPTMAQRWQHNPRGIADIAYGGRMGNGKPPSNDGWNYRGRGMSQVTGREGYAKLNAKLQEPNACGIDILLNPDAICDPRYTLECGIVDWLLCGCAPFAERDDIISETKHLNGGLNGIAERKRQLVLWKKELGC